MSAANASRRRRALGLALGVVALDQASKAIVEATIAMHARIEVTPFFELTRIMNPGVSFGMFAGLGEWGPLILSAVAIAVIAFLGRWLWRESRASAMFALGLVIGGAVGNLIDRVRLGAVIDFVSLHAGPYYWPAFNVADSAIVVGAALLVWDGFSGDGARDDRARSEESEERSRS